MNNHLSAFGPLGKSKLLYNDSGGSIVTRDGLQLYKLLEESVCHCLIKQCVNRIEHCGNGILTLNILLQSVFDSLYKQPSCSRIHCLRAIEAIIKAYEIHSTDIQAHFISKGAWKVEQNIRNWLINICTSIVATSCEWIMSVSLLGILENWLLTSNQVKFNEIVTRCRYILANSDTLMFSSLDGRESAPMLSSSPVTPYYLPASEVIIQGNCYDLVALSNNINNRFVCIQHFTSFSASNVDTAGISIAFDSSIRSFSNVLSQHDSTLSIALEYMLTLGINVILCEDVVDEAFLFTIASKGIYVVDRVNSSHLNYICERCQSHLFYNSLDFIDACVDSLPVEMVKFAISGKFRTLKRLKFIDGQYQNDRSASFYQISGLGKENGESVSSFGNQVPQLVVRYLTLAQCGTCFRLLKRCLQAVQFSQNDERREIPIVVAGGGTSESSWYRLWKRVGSQLVSITGREDSVEGSIAKTILTQFDQYPSDIRRSLIIQCVYLCETIAEGYKHIAQQLLRSCIHVMDSPIQGNGIALSKFDKAWSFWVNNEDSLGIIVSLDPSSLDLCKFGNTLEAGVYTTQAEFSAIFVQCLESIRVFFRIGGRNASVVRIKRKV